MTELPHNPLNGVTAGVWLEGGDGGAPAVVRKILTRRRDDAPERWAASDDPRHWNYWRREALAYTTDLPGRLGLAAPRLLDATTTAEGDVELRLEHVQGRHAGTLTADDLAAAARALGTAQGRPRDELPDDPWLSRGFLRDYSTSRASDPALLDDDAAWARPLVAARVDADLRAGLLDFHADLDRLVDLAEALPRTVCHLDVWPVNLIRREAGGEVVLLDWSFTGDGAIGEDIGTLILDAVLDGYLPHARLPDLDAALTAAYVDGLRGAGWGGDPRVARLGICAAAVKYDWLIESCLQASPSQEHAGYGGTAAVDADARFAARVAGLAQCARWAAEARGQAAALGF